jgi:hypothetical protein
MIEFLLWSLGLPLRAIKLYLKVKRTYPLHLCFIKNNKTLTKAVKVEGF